jgi:hypothetical protein
MVSLVLENIAGHSKPKAWKRIALSEWQTCVESNIYFLSRSESNIYFLFRRSDSPMVPSYMRPKPSDGAPVGPMR